MDSRGPRGNDFMSGYVDTKYHKYMNVGHLTSPYPGKEGHGDYGPSQGGSVYYRPANFTYPYLMDYDAGNMNQPDLGYGEDITIRTRIRDAIIHDYPNPVEFAYPQPYSSGYPYPKDGRFGYKRGCSSCSN